MKMIEKVGDECPLCHQKVNAVIREDLRSREDKIKYPLTKEQLTILNCACLHPGDLYVGGFF
jgi:hypothetical protein